MNEWYDALLKSNVDVRHNEPLSRHCSFRIGGPAALALFPKDAEELQHCLSVCRENGKQPLIIGRGSNVLFPDGGIPGTVIFTTAMRQCVCMGNRITAAAGLPLAYLATEAQRRGLSGMEFAHGIPGTLGGAIVMNAGAYDGAMETIVASSRYCLQTTGETFLLTNTEHAFGYRTSIYAKHPEYVLLDATVELTPDDPTAILTRMEALAARRRTAQPLEFPSAGSVFQRPKGHFAGKLIEDCGLKGFRIGGAEVSTKHAGFIVNRGNATAKDVRTLVQHIQTTVLQQYGVALECEIRFVDGSGVHS